MQETRIFVAVNFLYVVNILRKLWKEYNNIPSNNLRQIPPKQFLTGIISYSKGKFFCL